MPKMQAGVTSGYDRKGSGGGGKGKKDEPEPELEESEEEESGHLDNDTFAARRNKVNAESFMNERMPWEVAEEDRKRKLEEFNRKRAAMKNGRPQPHQPVKKDDRPAYEVRALGRQVEGGFDATAAVNSTLSAYNQLRERQQEQAKDQNAPKPVAHLDPSAVGPGIKLDPLAPPPERKPQPGRQDKFASWQGGEPPAPAAPAGRPATGPLQRPAGPANARPAGQPPQRPGPGQMSASVPAAPRPAEPARKPAEPPARPAPPREPQAERPRPVAPKPEPVAEAPKAAPQEPIRPAEPVQPEPQVVEKVVPVAAAASMAAKGDFACQYLIVDTFTGFGVPGARLEFEPISNDMLPVVNGTADTKGWYRIKDLAPGEYQLTVRYPGYIPESITVTIVAGQMDEGQILLKRP